MIVEVRSCSGCDYWPSGQRLTIIYDMETCLLVFARKLCYPRDSLMLIIVKIRIWLIPFQSGRLTCQFIVLAVHSPSVLISLVARQSIWSVWHSSCSKTQDSLISGPFKLKYHLSPGYAYFSPNGTYIKGSEVLDLVVQVQGWLRGYMREHIIRHLIVLSYVLHCIRRFSKKLFMGIDDTV